MSQKIVEQSTPCVSCGYDLQKLAHDGACPECDTPIADSLAGDALALADPRWLMRTIRGFSLLSFGLLVTLVGALAGLALTMLLMVAFFVFTQRPDVVITIVVWLVYAIVAIGLLATTVGSVMVTSMEPRETDREPAWSARRLARGGMATAAGLLLLSMSLGFAGLPVIQALVVTLLLAGWAAFTIGLVASLRWFAQLASRMPGCTGSAQLTRDFRELARQLRNSLVLVLACVLGSRILAILPVISLPESYFPVGVNDFLEMVLGIVSLVVFVRLVVQGVRLAGTMRHMRRALRSVQPQSPSGRRAGKSSDRPAVA